MKNKMNKIALMIVWTLVMTACGSDDPQTATCTEVEVENTTYCVFEQGIIVETGYQCPESYGNFHAIGDANVCSPDDLPPSEDLLEKIIDERDRPTLTATPTGDERCEPMAEQRTMCGKTPQPILECEEDLRCADEKFAPGATTVIVECFAGLGCTESDDKCSSTTTLGLTDSAAATAHKDTCLIKRQTCTSFSDDFCFMGIYSDATISELTACLELPCDEISKCLEAATCG